MNHLRHDFGSELPKRSRSRGFPRGCVLRWLETLLPLLILLWVADSSMAQTVRPLIAELGNPAKGRVEYVNDSLTPLNVVLTAKSFTVSEDGELSYRVLDSNLH